MRPTPVANNITNGCLPLLRRLRDPASPSSPRPRLPVRGLVNTEKDMSNKKRMIDPRQNQKIPTNKPIHQPNSKQTKQKGD
jgi:hypothetical protein